MIEFAHDRLREEARMHDDGSSDAQTSSKRDPSKARDDSSADPAHDDAERVLSLVTGAVAHKLKQPLSVAWGYTELLLEAPPADFDPTTLHCLREIDASLRRMDDVINQLQHATMGPTRRSAGGGEMLELDMPSESPQRASSHPY
jgi:signal transduction histidine kinase